MIPTSVLRAMQAAGATAEMILAAIEADEKANAETKAKRREQNRINQRNHRARQQESALTCDDNRLHALTADDGTTQSINNKDSLSDSDSKNLSFLLSSSGVLLEKKEDLVVARECKPHTNQRGSRLPDDWEPPQELFNFSLSLGFSEQEFHAEMDQFKDHWGSASGQNSRKTNWLKAAKNWLRNARKFQRQPSSKGNVPRPGSWADRTERSARAYDKLSEYIEANTDVPSPSSGTSQETAPQLRLVAPT